jgi:cytochrome c biogenesis protein CcdA
LRSYQDYPFPSLPWRVITSIFRATLTAYLGYLNVFVEALLVTTGTSLLFDLNIFNIFGNFSALANPKQEGLFGGFLLGLSLGIIWLPCVGPVLGSILTMAAVSVTGFKITKSKSSVQSLQWLLFQARLFMEH